MYQKRGERAQALARLDGSQTDSLQTRGHGAIGHAAAKPSAPLHAHAGDAARHVRLGASVKGRVRAGVVRLTAGAQQSRNRRKQGQHTNRRRAVQTRFDVRQARNLRRENVAHATGSLVRQHGVTENAAGVHHTVDHTIAARHGAKRRAGLGRARHVASLHHNERTAAALAVNDPRKTGRRTATAATEQHHAPSAALGHPTRDADAQSAETACHGNATRATELANARAGNANDNLAHVTGLGHHAHRLLRLAQAPARDAKRLQKTALHRRRNADKSAADHARRREVQSNHAEAHVATLHLRPSHGPDVALADLDETAAPAKSGQRAADETGRRQRVEDHVHAQRTGHSAHLARERGVARPEHTCNAAATNLVTLRSAAGGADRRAAKSAQNARRSHAHAASGGMHENALAGTAAHRPAESQLDSHVHCGQRRCIRVRQVTRNGGNGVHRCHGVRAKTPSSKSEHGIADAHKCTRAARGRDLLHNAGEVAAGRAGVAGVHVEHVQHVPEVQADRVNLDETLICRERRCNPFIMCRIQISE